MPNPWTRPWRGRPINPDEYRASQIKKAIQAGDLPGTAGGQADHAQVLQVLNPLPTPKRKSVNFNALVPRSRWRG